MCSYTWDLESGNGFGLAVLLKKQGGGAAQKIGGCWDSIHVVEVSHRESQPKAAYKVTSTVMLWLKTQREAAGTMSLGGSYTRQIDSTVTVRFNLEFNHKIKEIFIRNQGHLFLFLRSFHKLT